MATYAIGDVQGCLSQLKKLLIKINFDEAKDTLWFTGDLINRGPESLETLRFIKALGDKHIIVLGNHDLHLLAVAYGLRKEFIGDTLSEILIAPDKNELMEWLRHKPLLHYDKKNKYVMVHAGLAPAWHLDQAFSLAQEIENILRETPELLLNSLYGNEPYLWDNNLVGENRWRCIINFFTRMRFCHQDGRLDFSYKDDITHKPQELIPWFDVPHRANADEKIVFGHWAALNGETNTPNVFALDTGCVWGKCLTAMRLEDEVKFSVNCD